MDEIRIDLENCYGIRRLNAVIDFSRRATTAIYAPNGMMKSSLAQTFFDLSTGAESKDRIYTERLTKRAITSTDGEELEAQNVFVIRPYDEEYRSERMSTLLVNKELKDEYDSILLGIDKRKEALVKELKKLSGVKRETDQVLAKTFTREGDFLKAMGRVEREVMEENDSTLGDIVYSEIFNPKVEAFLDQPDIKNNLEEYTSVYDTLLSNSNFFKKGIFNHYQASEIAKQLKNHGFFKADHSVYINDKTERKEIKTEAELEELISTEKEQILKSPELNAIFNKIDNKLSNQELRDFREYLLNHQNIINELNDVDLFKEKLWKAYLIRQKTLFRDLMEEYNSGKVRLQEISGEATRQATDWQDVINIFNRRFSVPFIVHIENQEDVILKQVTPNIRFNFFDGPDDRDQVPIERKQLLESLSNGERRALYILNIIFEVQARKAAGIPTLFIVDDIADSFDYKNKYAIVEYLNDMHSQENFFLIVLTHNYDFYRTISTRLTLGGSMFHAVKDGESTRLELDPYYGDIFKRWKNQLENPGSESMVVAMIPFVRNLAEYCGYDDEETKLTKLLHIKDGTADLLVSDLQSMFREVLKGADQLTLQNPDKTVLNLIYEEAQRICDEQVTGIELDKKVTLSMAIRLKAEEFLIQKIANPDYVGRLRRSQTGMLIKEYKKLYGEDSRERKNLEIVERVNLMTPENIHLNSFMYEPILDMSNDHLKSLFRDISEMAQ